MKDKKKWIIGISACVLLMVSVFFVFNQGKSNEQVVTEYFELLKKKDYKQMYQMLNSKTVYTPTQKYFVEKYKEAFAKDPVISDDMAAPAVTHQEIAFEIAVALRKYIKDKGGKCKVFMSPVDVQLDKDDKTMVQPDVFLVCDQSKNTGRCIYGAPDMVIEVTSPSTRKKDFGKKLGKYVDAGVREYWIVDVKNQKVIVYDLGEDFGENMDLMIYGMDGEVPVGIYDGECKIDFEEIVNSVVNI